MDRMKADSVDGDQPISLGYSMPKSMHERVMAEAKKRDWNRSQLVRQAIRDWFFQEELKRKAG